MTPRTVVSRTREFFPTSHSDLRATWHPEADTLVLTLWSGNRCAGSAPLSPVDAGRLLSFIARCLAERVTAPLHRQDPPASLRGTARRMLQAVRRRATAQLPPDHHR